MVDKDLHPHTVTAIKQTGTTDPQQDDLGNWIKQNPTTLTLTSECRAIPNGDQKKTRGINGDMIDFDFMVSLPKDTADFFAGLEVEIIDQFGKSIFKGEIKRFFRGAEIARMWV